MSIHIGSAEISALHEKLGFKQVGQLHKTGFKFDQWLDVGIFQKQL